MSSKVYLFRHGETEWSKSGKHTGLTDLPLTEHGESRILHSAARLLGPDALIQTPHIAQIIVSPRLRAQQTLALLDLDASIPVTSTEDISEWNYGSFEGLTTREINDTRQEVSGHKTNETRQGSVHETNKTRGQSSSSSSSVQWNVFRDGCPGGDSPESIALRLGPLIERVRGIHERGEQARERRDVLIVAHGHILRAFAAMWIGLPVSMGTRLAYGAGGAGVLGYEHGSLEEPTIEVWNVTDLTLK